MPARSAASAPSRPGATRWPRPGWSASPQLLRAIGLELSGLLPRRHVPGSRRRRAGRPRATTTGAPSTKPATLNAACLVLVVGGLPGALAGKAGAQGHRRRARSRCATASPRLLEYARERQHAAGDRAAAPDVRRRPRLHQHAGAGARPVRCARPAPGALDGSDRGALGVAVDVYHVWWDPKLQAQIERAGRSACSPSMSATGSRRPRDLLERPRHDGRRRDRHPAHPRLGGGRRASPATARSRSSPPNWWQRDGGEVLDTCIERHRSAV